MTAKLKVCFNYSEPCAQETVIYDHVLVTKQPCQYNATYLQPGKYYHTNRQFFMIMFLSLNNHVRTLQHTYSQGNATIPRENDL